MKNFKGVFTALLTPFGKDGKINEKVLERLVKFNIDMGVSGFYVCGSTAEAFLLSTDERKEIMDVVIYKNNIDSLRRCIFLYFIIFSWKPLIKLRGNREKTMPKPFICHERTCLL